MNLLRSEQLVTYAKDLYAGDQISVDELEERIHRALTGEASDDEWIKAARHAREQGRSPQSLESVDAILKSAYLGPIRSPHESF
jgi:cobalamin biosynthesis Mg chelatase CobN